MKKHITYRLITIVCFTNVYISSIQASELSELKNKLQALHHDVRLKQQQIKLLEQEIAASEYRDAKRNRISNIIVPNSTSDASKKSIETSTKLIYYWDNRDFNTFALVTSAKRLPGGFSFWGFTDLHGDHNKARESIDHTRFFMEYRLSRSIKPKWALGIKGLGFQAEFNDSQGSNNNLLRAGLTFKHTIPSFTKKKGWLQWRGFPVESDGDGGQASVIYNFPLHDRIWISGFADVNFINKISDRWVIEPQLNIRLSDLITLAIEYRQNGFERAAAGVSGKGIALGLSMSF